MIKKYITVIFLLVFGVLLSSFVFYGYQLIKAPNVLVEQEDRLFFISNDADFKQVQQQFIESDIVNNIVAFSFVAKLMDYDKMVKPGRYLLKSNMTNVQAIRLLRSGEQHPVKVTFNNIRLKEEIAPKLIKNTSVTETDFNKALDGFIKSGKSEFNEQTIISMFIPNTYQVYYSTSADGLVERMYAEYLKFWNDDRKSKAEALGLSLIEVSTLASIVQAESIKAIESSIIAGLYLNRLKKRIPLQADPTLVFAARDFTLIRVLNKHKEIDSPYNTYKNRGLPPGPINMPHIRSIDAVLNYEKHSYLYMCAREDFSGHHNFASTLSEHSRNAQKYQRALTIEMQKAKRDN